MTFSASSRRVLHATLGVLLGASLSACGGGGSGGSRPTPLATPTTTPAPNGAGLLVFAMAPDGAEAAQTDIFSANPDGSGLKRLTVSAPDAAGDVQPQGSPTLSFDRRQIIWVSVAFGNGQSESTLRIMNADGSNPRLLTADLGARGATTPAWSPDGTRLAFSLGNGGIYLIGADGANLRQLTDRGANPAWSVGNRIAFNAAPGVQATSNRVAPGAARRRPSGVLPPTTDAASEIFTIGADGSGLRQLTQRSQTEAGLASINPAWSPDGQTLIFNTIPGSGIAAQLFLIGADGTNRRTLGDLNGTDAVWSPDGNRIAYSDESGFALSNRDGTARALVGAPDGLFVEDTDWR